MTLTSHMRLACAWLWLASVAAVAATPGEADRATAEAALEAAASETAETEEDAFDEEGEAPGAKAHGGPGIGFASGDGRFALAAWLRAQLRLSDPFDADPLSAAAFAAPPGSDFELRRSRVKVKGHLFDPRVGFYYEHELGGDHPLLDLRLHVVLREDLQVRLGQYKVLYNRERVDSSGKQTFVERSIATYAFTLDRQRGVTVGKHWGAGSAFDHWLLVGVMEGDGRDPGRRGDGLMWLARWQWNLFGRPTPFSQSDIALSEEPSAALSFAGARVRGPYTRFSSSGGGQLDGFEAGGDERYTLEQGLQEFAYRHGGFSVQQEYHRKRITDHEAGRRSTLSGGYLSVGQAWAVPGAGQAGWELAARVARVDWDGTPRDRRQDEFTVGANLFLDGHDHKFTADVSRLSLREDGAGTVRDTRFRLQWDLSF